MSATYTVSDNNAVFSRLYRSTDRDRTLYESLAGDLLDQRGAADTTYTTLAGELLRHGPRGWVTPDGRRESVAAVAVGLWIEHVRTLRARREAREAREAADALLAWWDDLDVDGCGRDAVRAVAQELRLLRGPVTFNQVHEARALARAWGFVTP